MAKNTSLDPRYNYALSQLFSPSLLKKMTNNFDEQNIRRFLSNCNLYSENDEWNLIRALDIAYEYLKKNYRCEYVYKNEIANQLLLKYHYDNSATLLKEVPSNSSIADIVIVNGKTIAYEIKTELDSFDRLTNQVKAYQMLYDELYVVTYPEAVSSLKAKIGCDIGIIVLDKNGKLITLNKAANNYQKFSPDAAVLTLRQSELVAAYEKYVGLLPVMGTALIHDFCLQWYISIEKLHAHTIFAEALKSRRPSVHQFKLIKQCNPSLKMLFLGKEMSRKNCMLATNRLGIFD